MDAQKSSTGKETGTQNTSGNAPSNMSVSNIGVKSGMSLPGRAGETVTRNAPMNPSKGTTHPLRNRTA